MAVKDLNGNKVLACTCMHIKFAIKQSPTHLLLELKQVSRPQPLIPVFAVFHRVRSRSEKRSWGIYMLVEKIWNLTVALLGDRLESSVQIVCDLD